MDPDEGFEILTNRDVSSVMPTEFVLTLVKRKIAQIDRKTILLDGFPRKADQVNYSLYFRDLINFREDPDLFILINIPLQIISDRMLKRRICPVCKTSRNLELNPTRNVGYDKKKGEFYIKCDDPNCPDEPIMVSKEGDDKGVEYLKERLINDYQLMDMIRGMYGVPKIELYNAVETDKADELLEEYELTHMYRFEREEKEGEKIITSEKELYKIKDDGKEYYSLLPAPVVIQLIKQLVEIFNL
jgi:adenylate kinase family enzyme